jgi:hypothetical protein
LRLRLDLVEPLYEEGEILAEEWAGGGRHSVGYASPTLSPTRTASPAGNPRCLRAPGKRTPGLPFLICLSQKRTHLPGGEPRPPHGASDISEGVLLAIAGCAFAIGLDESV